MHVDPYILTFSALTVIATIWMGFWSARKSKTASDFFVAGRSVSVGWNASAISGEYLSAASFMGVAGMVMSSGYDALWYPVCYACGYLFLLLFIAGPLRRFGAYTIPDFAEGRFDSPLFRKIAVVFVLFIGFFYTMPQMKGAGTTLAYIFQDVDLRGGWFEFLAPHNDKGEALKGFPYWAGVLVVGAVITLNVALGGMKGITLVQAFQYWTKMFAISLPIFVLMAVYGHYGRQIAVNTKEAFDVPRQSAAGGSAPYTKGYLLLEKVRREKPAPAEGGLSADGKNAYDEGHGGYVVFNELAESYAQPTLKHGLRYFWDTLRGQEGYGFGAQVPKLHYGAALNLLAHLEGWRIVTFENHPAAIVDIRTYGTRKQYRTGILAQLATNGISVARVSVKTYLAYPAADSAEYQPVIHALAARGLKQPLPEKAPADATWLSPFGPLTAKAAKAANISPEKSKPYALLYTYSLIIALVCGTAGLPHILVRFYTNPDGVAAKRTTMWVMILIGVFYIFPPVFGVMGRNLMPSLYEGTGAKGTDKVVLELPRILNHGRDGVSPSQTSAASQVRDTNMPSLPNQPAIPWGSILSGITCAGAFAAFMSTFSGLLVSMTGAMAHDVYGRMLNPKSSPQQRLRAFKIAAVGIGAVAIVLGTFVEPLQINFMVGQAFAIAAASYFPLLFVSCWWRGLTMKGAATGMLTGGVCALLAVSLTNFSDLAQASDKTAEVFAFFKPMAAFWAAHPLLRILCEQPAIWCVPLAIGLMLVVSHLTRRDIPADIRMKMLVLHAPEKLGLKQEYIQEHQHGH